MTPVTRVLTSSRRSRFVKPFGLRVDLDELERLVGLAGVTGLCAGDDEWLFALGWAGAVATSARQRLLVSALLVAGVWGFWGPQPRREVIVAGGLLLPLWVPNLPVPRPFNRMVGLVAGMSLALYLTHWQVYPPLLRTFGPAAAFAGAVVAAWPVWAAYETIRRR